MTAQSLHRTVNDLRFTNHDKTRLKIGDQDLRLQEVHETPIDTRTSSRVLKRQPDDWGLSMGDVENRHLDCCRTAACVFTNLTEHTESKTQFRPTDRWISADRHLSVPIGNHR